MTSADQAQQIDDFVNQLLLMSENQRELLLGGQPNPSITLTQGHLLMLLLQCGDQTNGELAHALNVSPAAVTKAMKGLQKEAEPFVTVRADADDGRVNRWALTPAGKAVAQEHESEHVATQAEYRAVMDQFSPQEQLVIQHFLSVLSQTLAGGGKYAE
ncbi:DNA-binding MarR family transcriptional regulator [Weissella uvarum]|uniref:MarR family winged helix-turn-helix transcriptional regulator n=1 Tax=Weissella uvarum TaxID=1479233 RepID=UPI0019619B21|nr:MarR family transcriptional regulator [Weissella uvarum]MBM7616866.1 DNA-binding MarR family transcriptional regulator [Weissella uvarum]MCM0594682.1 MarR family transcriptional regulator [Weissella uvarum]